MTYYLLITFALFLVFFAAKQKKWMMETPSWDELEQERLDRKNLKAGQCRTTRHEAMLLVAAPEPTLLLSVILIAAAIRCAAELQKQATTGEAPDVTPQGTQMRAQAKTPSSARERQREAAEERRATCGDTWSRSGGNYHLVR